MLPLLLSLLLFSIATLPLCSSECTPNHKFWACCHQIGIESMLVDVDNLINKACQYPPEELTTGQGIALGFYLSEYKWCYGDAQNNRDCCARAAVSANARWAMFFTADCRDLCDGRLPRIDAKPGYNACADYRSRIAQCNKDANNMETDTAIRQYNLCKKGKLCERPMQWKEQCSQQ